jgi:hypothetical protein
MDKRKFIKMQLKDEQDFLKNVRNVRPISKHEESLKRFRETVNTIPKIKFAHEDHIYEGGAIVLPVLAAIIASLSSDLVSRGMSRIFGNGIDIQRRDGNKLSESDKREILSMMLAKYPYMAHDLFN